MRLVACALLLLVAARAHAQMGVEVAPDAEPAVTVRELAPLEHVATGGVLTIARTGPRTLTVTYRAADGTELRRTLELDLDPETNTQRVVMLAENLVRDEAAEILAELTPPVDARTVMIEPAVVVTPAADMHVLRSHTRSRWALGVVGYLSARSDGIDAPGEGLFASYSLARNVAIGVTDVMVAPIEGQTVASGGPYVEACAFIVPRLLQAYGQAGALLQVRWGGRLGTDLGVQPFLGAGLRLWLSEHLSLGAGARASVVATDAYDILPTAVVQGTVMPSAGLELAVHL